MAKRRNKAINKEQTKPAYFRSRKLTVGMLQDMCALFKDKSTEVMIADRIGEWPTQAVRGFSIYGDKKTPGNLIIAGKFRWNQEDGDEVDPTEDTIINATEDDWENAYEGGLCSLEEPQDCVEMIPGLSYLNQPPPEPSPNAIISI